MGAGWGEGKASASFLKKRSKKLLVHKGFACCLPAPVCHVCPRQPNTSFLLLFCKKEGLALASPC
jgi:hypothetical protein